MIKYALLGTIGTWIATLLGAAIVIFFKKPKQNMFNFLLGFSAGVMISASFWSLLLPGLEIAIMLKQPHIIIVTLGVLSGAVFIWLTDMLLSQTGIKKNDSARKRTFMMLLAITIHNIPEGLVIGVAFGSIQTNDPILLLPVIGLTIGIGLQNIPEGAAASLALRRDGASRFKSFFLGQLSGIVEIISGVIGSILVIWCRSLLPWCLGFAAGAMIIVAVHELIPEAHHEKRSYIPTMGIILGFVVMMIFDLLFS